MDYKSIQNKLAGHSPQHIGHEQINWYSLLLPLIEKEDGMHLLFEVRSLNMRRQPGEICFPGGRVDQEDQNSEETAMREAVEELGIPTHLIKDVSSFGYMLSPFGMKIDAHVGVLDSTEDSLKPNPHEVEEVFTVPLEYFLRTEPEIHYIQMEVQPEEGFPYENIPNGKQYQWSKQRYAEHFYYYGDRVIWGLTARILYDFIKRLKG